jgi:hypothetical protein
MMHQIMKNDMQLDGGHKEIYLWNRITFFGNSTKLLTES